MLRQRANSERLRPHYPDRLLVRNRRDGKDWSKLIFKQADSPAEFQQIHHLNYRTFAEELGQYEPDGSGILIDRFDGHNTYFVAVNHDRVIGMVAAQDRAPFSIESRLADPGVLNSLAGPLLEVRLLAIEPEFRSGQVLPGLLFELYRFACERSYSHLIISGITSRLKMYHRLGFRPLGPPVPSGAASFVPMAMPIEASADYAAYMERRVRPGADKSVMPPNDTIQR